MFVAQAHSFTQQARLAITLAWVAGYTNIISVLAAGVVTSHVSGTTSNLGRDIAEGKWVLAGYALYLLATFFIGAMISGAATEYGRRRGWNSIYVLPMAIQAFLLGIFAFAIELISSSNVEFGSTLFWMTGLASVAMGLQNATITRISSGVVRTTHVTGVLTDLGLETVQFLWWIGDKNRDYPPGTARGLLRSVKHHPTGRRLALLASIVGSFAVGAALGTLVYTYATEWAMFPPVLFLLWIIYQDVHLPIVEIESSDLIGKEAGIELPDAMAVFHLRKKQNQSDQVHRMPDLLAWADRLKASTQVVILDLGDVTQIDANSAMELRAVLSRFSAQGRRLVISGLSLQQYQQLREAGTGEKLEAADVCPDLELAIARGLNILEDWLSGSRNR